ncbi:MAG: hypothetical protein ACYC9L_11025 [Sulfuricaulis sp.]
MSTSIVSCTGMTPTWKGTAQKVKYMATRKDVSKGWEIGGGRLSRGGTKINAFQKKIKKEVDFTG